MDDYLTSGIASMKSRFGELNSLSLEARMNEMKKCSILLARCDEMLTKQQLNEIRNKTNSHVQLEIEDEEQFETSQQNSRSIKISDNAKPSEDTGSSTQMSVDRDVTRKRKNTNKLNSDDSFKKKRKIELRPRSKTISEWIKGIPVIGMEPIEADNRENLCGSSEECDIGGVGVAGLKRSDNRKEEINKSKKSNRNESKQHKCEFCAYSSKWKFVLLRHMRTHTGDRPFLCTMCERGFTESSNLKKHMRTHANQFAFQCAICRQGFDLEEAKDSHERTCNSEQFQCDSCEYYTLRKNDFVRHMRTHTGEKPFQCELCEREFTLKGGLTRHMRTHTNAFTFDFINFR